MAAAASGVGNVVTPSGAVGGEVNTFQKALAMEALSDLTIGLTYTDPVKWIASIGAEIGGDGMLRGCAGYGATTDEAIEDLWSNLTNIPSDRHIFLSMKDRRVRWNGYMWQDVHVEKRTA